MKKTILYLAILAVLAVVAYKLYSGNSVLNADASIQVANTDKINKLFLSDRLGNTVTVIKKADNLWYVDGNILARQDRVENIFDVLRRAQATQPVPVEAHNTVVTALSGNGIKCEVYESDKLIQSFTIGGAVNKSVGNYAFKSGTDRPYIYKLKGFDGDFSVRFETDIDQWKSNALFHYNVQAIKKIKVQYTDYPDSSFEIHNAGNNWNVQAANGQMLDVDSAKANAYMAQFASFSSYGFENKLIKKDSIAQQGRAYGAITIHSNLGEEVYKLIYHKANQTADAIMLLDDGIKYDKELLFVYKKPDLMLASSYTMQKILVPYSYFIKK